MPVTPSASAEISTRIRPHSLHAHPHHRSVSYRATQQAKQCCLVGQPDPDSSSTRKQLDCRFCVHNHLCMVAGVEDADAVFFLGYHARTGDSDGVGNETILGREIVEIRLNGQPVGESEINAAVCGHFGVPVVFASGDDLYERELRQTLPAVEFGLTKYALDRWTARCLAPQRSRANIEAAAKKAVERAVAGEFQPYRLDGPVELAVTFSS